jgi:putative transposase
LPNREPQPLEVPAQINHTESFDFVSDALYGGRRFRCYNIIEEGTRDALDRARQRAY